MRIYAIIMLIVALLSIAFSGRPDVVFVTPAQISQLKKIGDPWVPLYERCEVEKVRLPSPIARYTPPAYYAHTKEALSYFDPLNNDGSSAFRLALCYRVTGNTVYAKTAENLIDSWASTVDYIEPESQGVSSFVNAYYSYIFAADMLRAHRAWDRSIFENFLRNRLLPLFDWAGQDSGSRANWTVLEWAAAGSYFNDAKLLERAHLRWNELVIGQIVEGGLMPHVDCRKNPNRARCKVITQKNDKLFAVHWANYPLVLAAEIFHHRGINIYNSYAGQKLQDSYEHTVKMIRRAPKTPQAEYEKLLNRFTYLTILRERFPDSKVNDDTHAILRKQDPYLNTLYLLLLYPVPPSQ